MNKNIFSTITKLAIGSLLLGLLLSAFSISPRNFLKGLGDTALGIFDAVAGVLEWAVQYILIGAIVVVPIWLIVIAWRAFRSK